MPSREGLGPCEEVYARRVPGRPGMLDRRPGWEHLPLLPGGRRREGAGELNRVPASPRGG